MLTKEHVLGEIKLAQCLDRFSKISLKISSFVLKLMTEFSFLGELSL